MIIRIRIPAAFALALALASVAVLAVAGAHAAAPAKVVKRSPTARLEKAATPPGAATAPQAPGTDVLQSLPPGISSEAETMLAALGASYADCGRYHFEGVSHMSMSAQGRTQAFDVPFRLAAVKPAKVLAEILNPAMSYVTVSDGAQTWTYVPQARQYTRSQTAPTNDSKATNAETGALFATGTPIQRYLSPRDGLVAARVAGQATLDVGGRTVHCTILQAQYAVPESAQIQMSPNTMWVDPEHALVLRDSMSVTMVGQGNVPVRLHTVTEYRVARVNQPVADSLFTFTAPAGVTLVDRIDMNGGAPPPRSPLVGKPAADFSLTDMAGRKQRLSALKGKVVLLDFWATWCGPCRRELPIIVKLHNELQKRGLAVVAVNVGEPAPQVAEFLKKNAYALPVWLDVNSEVADQYGASAIPTLVVIDRTGGVVEHVMGVHDEEWLRAIIKKAGL